MRPNNEGKVSLTVFDTMIRKNTIERIHIIANTQLEEITLQTQADIDSSALFLLEEFPIIIK